MRADLVADAAHLPQTQPQRAVLHDTVLLAEAHVHAQDLYPVPLRVLHHQIQRIETHRLGVQQRPGKLYRVIDLEPARDIGQIAECHGVTPNETVP
jgi:hypothetical protein